MLDWTNRKSAGVAFLVTALGILIGFYDKRVALLVAALFAISGIVLLAEPTVSSWFRARHTSGVAEPSSPILPPWLRIRSEGCTVGPDPQAPYVLRLDIESDNALANRWLRFHCDGPIYGSASRFTWLTYQVGEILPGPVATSLDVRFYPREFTAPGALIAELASVSPLRLQHVEAGVNAPAGPPAGMPSSRGG